MKLRFKQAAEVTGLLQTADGESIAGARVDVAEQAAGWRRRRVGAVRTNRRGEFAYTIAGGPSRTLVFSFPGTSTLRASFASTSVRVIGNAKIKVSRHAHAGRRLRVSGLVLGGYIPAAGILVQLQYIIKGVPAGWEPFHAPVHTNSHGRWNVTFQVPNAAGYTYEFRAPIASPQSGWPFLTARSNAIARAVS